MKTITKNEIFSKFGDDFTSTVTYKDGNKIKYGNPKNINWKQVLKITIDIPRRRHIIDGEVVTRNAVAYKFQE